MMALSTLFSYFTPLSASFWLPEAASVTAQNVDPLFYFVLYLVSFFLLMITVFMVIYTIKYRRKTPGQRTSAIKGNHWIEIIWTTIPTLIVIFIFAWGFRDWMVLNVPPGNALNVRVTGQKWTWTFEYPKEGITSTELVVPVGRPVKLIMSSVDVIHSFFVPQFRIKRDVIPNRYSVIWFEATHTGTYDVFCTEYCGAGHSQMLTAVKVLSEREYDEWVSSGGDTGAEGLSSVDYGKQQFTKQGCNVCHSVEGVKLVGPPLNGLFGKKETLMGGIKAAVDDNYLRESLMDPNAKVVEGFAPAMPTYKGRLNDKQVNALIDYLKSLENP